MYVALSPSYIAVPVPAAMDIEPVQMLHTQERRSAERPRNQSTTIPKDAYEEDIWHAEAQALEDRVGHPRVQVNAATEACDDQCEDESDPSGESECSVSSVEDGATVEDSVTEDMNKFEDSFKGIAERYRLIKRIGEGC